LTRGVSTSDSAQIPGGRHTQYRTEGSGVTPVFIGCYVNPHCEWYTEQGRCTQK